MSSLSRRAFMALGGAAAIGTGLSWRRLSGLDIPGRNSDALSVCINGTAQDAAANQGLIDAFHKVHPDIPARITPVQGEDQSDFFAKVLTLVAAGTAPDVVMVATEGTQLFADRLAYPLDEFVMRDKADMQEYFDDVHPSLVESFMYQGHLYELPMDYNAANMFMSSKAMTMAGLDYPDMHWTWDDFHGYLKAMKKSATGSFRPFFWTNRLFGGIVPWLYTNDTSFIKPQRFTGGKWFWNQFYPKENQRSGGFRWTEPNAEDPKVVEAFEFMQELIAENLASSPVQGGGNELVSRFSEGVIGMTPAGGYWVEGLIEAGMKRTDYDAAYFPKGRTQQHQFGSTGYTIMKSSDKKDAAWEWIKFCSSLDGMRIVRRKPDSTAARRSWNTELYKNAGPRHWDIFYNTVDKFPTSAPIPAPPQEAAVESALIKNVTSAVTGSRTHVKVALKNLQRDLEQAFVEE